jgi:tripartite-type tricarboxylate transporter receptor subunit TctC
MTFRPLSTRGGPGRASSPVRRRAVAALAAVAPLVLHAAPAVAQGGAYPSRPVRVVVPYPPGGPNDILARMLGARLGDGWNQPVVIDNRPGAGGNIGTVTVTRANPDGHTVVLHAMAVAVNPTLYGDAVPYKLSELAPVTLVARGPLVMTVHPSVPANSVKEFLALARARPGSINYGSGGNGSSLHLAGELFKAQSGAAITHIPYKGTALSGLANTTEIRPPSRSLIMSALPL